jgi:glycosyltransferase involved in cell wall biosynthesis
MISPSAHRPRVSVIIPCYRVTAFVAEALDSLRAQSFQDFEAIVVNDGCPDTENLERALSPYRDHIVYLKQPNGGIGAARNTAIRAARAPLIAQLDPDDIWEPQYLELHAGFLDENPQFDAIYPNARWFGDNPWAGRFFMDEFPSRGEVTFLSVLRKECSIHAAVTARRAAMERAGLFDTSFRASEDLDLWLRMLHGGSRFAYNTEALVRHRLRRASLSDQQDRIALATLKVYAKLLGTLELSDEEREALVDAINDADAELHLISARQALYGRNSDRAIHSFTKANSVRRNKRLWAAICVLRVCPQVLFAYVHRRFPSKELYVR